MTPQILRHRAPRQTSYRAHPTCRFHLWKQFLKARGWQSSTKLWRDSKRLSSPSCSSWPWVFTVYLASLPGLLPHSYLSRSLISQMQNNIPDMCNSVNTWSSSQIKQACLPAPCLLYNPSTKDVDDCTRRLLRGVSVPFEVERNARQRVCLPKII